MTEQKKPTITIQELRELAAEAWPGVSLDCDTFGKNGERITILTPSTRLRFSNAHTRADPDRVRRQVKETLQSLSRARPGIMAKALALAQAHAGLES